MKVSYGKGVSFLAGAFAIWILEKIFDLSESTIISSIPNLSYVDVFVIVVAAIGFGIIIYKTLQKRRSEEVQNTKPIATSTIEELPKVHDEKNPEVVNDFLNHMKNDCFVSGISLGTFATGYQDKIVDLIQKKGKHFTFLLPHPNSKFMEAADDLVVSLDSRSELINELKRFNQLHNKLKGDAVHKMTVKFHHLPLVHSMLVVDPELDDNDGKMDISLYDFNKDSRRRTGITIKKKHSKELFEKHYRSLKVMLDHKGTSDWDFEEFLSGK